MVEVRELDRYEWPLWWDRVEEFLGQRAGDDYLIAMHDESAIFAIDGGKVVGWAEMFENVPTTVSDDPEVIEALRMRL